MPALHAYFPSAPDRDREWAFAAARSTLAGSKVTFATTANPFTKQENLKAVVEETFHLTLSFESGAAVDADLDSIADGRGTGFSRIRVIYGPDPNNDYTDWIIELMNLFESFDQVLVYGVDAESIFFDTLSPSVA